jgi:hypothetical protein
MSYPLRWCSLHGDWYEAPPTFKVGYCRPCWNGYQSWRHQRTIVGLPAGMNHYRDAVNKPYIKRPRRENLLTDCSVCLRHPRDRGAYCNGCHSAYVQWSRKRAVAGLSTGIEEFRAAVDSDRVVPRHVGEYHLGRVVRGI